MNRALLPRRLDAIVLGGGLLWLYASTARSLIAQWLSDSDASYGIVLAAIAIAVAWRRRGALLAAAPSRTTDAAGLAFVLLGGLLYLAGFFSADLFLTRVSFLLIASGGVWFVCGGRALRTMLAPLVLFAAAIPLPTIVVNEITLPMQVMASGFAESLLSAAQIPVVREGNVLRLPSAALQVAEACSGLRSAVSLTALGMLLAWGTTPHWPARVAIVAAAVPVAIVTNALRIAATGIATETWGPKAASGDWHTFTGWVAFVVAMLTLLAIRGAVSGLAARVGRSHAPARVATA
jgi:exosortase